MKKQKVHIATLGFNEQGRIKYVLNSTGGHKIFIIYSIETEQDMTRVAADLRTSGNWDVEPILVDAWNYNDVLHKVVTIAVENHTNELFFNPSLGTRIMTAALFAAANFTGSKVYLVKEDRQQHPVDIVEVEPVQRQTLSAPKKSVLKVLQQAGDTGVSSMGALATKVGRSRSSVSEHVKTLTSWGYSRTMKDKGTKHVWITLLGSAVLEMAKLWDTKKPIK